MLFTYTVQPGLAAGMQSENNKLMFTERISRTQKTCLETRKHQHLFRQEFKSHLNSCKVQCHSVVNLSSSHVLSTIMKIKIYKN
jgi:hypothetical protein